VLNETEGEESLSTNGSGNPPPFPSPTPAPKSGMDALMDNEFLAGISKQFKTMVGEEEIPAEISTPPVPEATSISVTAETIAPVDNYTEMADVVKDELE